MAYLFNSPEQQRLMLETIGVETVDQLFNQIPGDLRLKRPLNLPPALTELELEALLRESAGRNQGGSSRICFQGGGSYDHFIPAAVDAVAVFTWGK